MLEFRQSFYSINLEICVKHVVSQESSWQHLGHLLRFWTPPLLMLVFACASTLPTLLSSVFVKSSLVRYRIRTTYRPSHVLHVVYKLDTKLSIEVLNLRPAVKKAIILLLHRADIKVLHDALAH